MDVPDTAWLSEEYFRSLFRRKSPGEAVSVERVSVQRGDGERVSTPAGARTLSYVVKFARAPTPARAHLFRTEAPVLGHVIPAMKRALDAAAPGKYGPLAPRLVDHGPEGRLFLVTEDVGCRREGLDLEQSLAYAQHLGAVLERYGEGLASTPRSVDSEGVTHLNGLIEASVGVPGGGTAFAEQVWRLGGSLPVLCHGDVFVHNILFRREGGGGGFADDLAGFLARAAPDDVALRRWERVAEAYREALNADLLALGLSGRALSADALRAQRAVTQSGLFLVLPRSRSPAATPQHALYIALLLQLLLPLEWLDEPEKSADTVERQPLKGCKGSPHLSPADTAVQSVRVSTLEEEKAPTLDVEAKPFHVRCPADGFCKTPATSSVLEMEAPAPAQSVAAAEASVDTAVPKTTNTATPTEDLSKAGRPVTSTVQHRAKDLKYCLAILRHLAILHAASMIALDHNYGVSNVPTVPVSTLWRYLQDFIQPSSIKELTTQLPKKNKEYNSEEIKKPRTAFSEKHLRAKKQEARNLKIACHKPSQVKSTISQDSTTGTHDIRPSDSQPVRTNCRTTGANRIVDKSTEDIRNNIKLLPGNSETTTHDSDLLLPEDSTEELRREPHNPSTDVHFTDDLKAEHKQTRRASFSERRILRDTKQKPRNFKVARHKHSHVDSTLPEELETSRIHSADSQLACTHPRTTRISRGINNSATSKREVDRVDGDTTGTCDSPSRPGRRTAATTTEERPEVQVLCAPIPSAGAFDLWGGGGALWTRPLELPGHCRRTERLLCHFDRRSCVRV